MQILLVCQFYFVYSKKKYIKEHKKKQKLSWNTDARNRTWAVCVRVRYRSRNFNEFAYKLFQVTLHNPELFCSYVFFNSL